MESVIGVIRNFANWHDEKYGHYYFDLLSNQYLLWIFPVFCIVPYLLMLVLLPKYMKSREVAKSDDEDGEPSSTPKRPTTPGATPVSKPHRRAARPLKGLTDLSLLDWLMLFHNGGLCLVTFCAWWWCLPTFIIHTYDHGWIGAVCDGSGVIPARKTPLHTGSYLFTWMKVVELLDTVYKIIRNPKRKVIFLHWYHHVTVLIYCWYAHIFQIPTNNLFAFINGFIHVLMYYYYSCMVFNYRPSWAKLLTKLQIAQMFCGLGILVFFFYYHYFAGGCHTRNIPGKLPPEVFFIYAALMYGSYLALFVQFYVGRYLKKKPTGGGGGGGGGEESGKAKED